MLFRRLPHRITAATVAGTVALLMTSCSSAEGPAAVESPASTSLSAVEFPITGVLTLKVEAEGSQLFLHDPSDGLVTHKLSIPGPLPHSADRRERASDIRSRFSADWAMVTWVEGGAVHVAERRGRQAVPGAGERISEVVFAPDGSRVLVQTGSRWFAAILDDSGTPTPYSLTGGGGVPVGWS